MFVISFTYGKFTSVGPLYVMNMFISLSSNKQGMGFLNQCLDYRFLVLFRNRSWFYCMHMFQNVDALRSRLFLIPWYAYDSMFIVLNLIPQNNQACCFFLTLMRVVRLHHTSSSSMDANDRNTCPFFKILDSNEAAGCICLHSINNGQMYNFQMTFPN